MGSTGKLAYTPTPLALALAKDYPDIEKVVRLRDERGAVKYKDRVFMESLLFVDSDFLEIFTFPLLRGDLQTTLRHRASIVVSQEKAHQYFGQDDPIGRKISVRIDEKYVDFIVEGVTAKAPVNSSIQFDFLLPIERMPNYERWAESWGSTKVISFALLRANAKATALTPSFSNLCASTTGQQFRSTKNSVQWP